MAVFTGQGSAASPSITFSADTATGIFSPAGSEIGISTAGTGRFFIDSAGNVGVGGSATGARLDVRAPSVLVRAISTTTTNPVLWSGTNTTGALRLGVESSTGGSLLFGSSAYSTILGSETNHSLHLGTNATTRLTIGTAGNVGIGVTAPDSTLHVLAGAVAGLRVGFNGTSVNYYDADTQVFRNIAGAERARIDSSGNVGIGTPTPQARLEVKSGSLKLRDRFGGASYAYEVDADNVTAYSQKMITTRFMDEVGGSLIDMTSINTDVESSGANQYALTFKTTGQPGGGGSPVERMRITGLGVLLIADAGNITVGTTTGTKIGTATTQKIGFYNATPVVQPTAVADATDAATVIARLNDLLGRLRTLGIIAT